MYYSSGNYEAFATPKKPEGVDHKSAYIIGSGLAALTAACYLVRDGQMKGEHVHILEKDSIPGGACDGYKFENVGYVMRGGREMDNHFEVMWDLFRSIPSIETEGVSVLDEYYWLNKEDPNYSLCRATVDRGQDAHTDGKFDISDKGAMEIMKLFFTPNEDLQDKKITDFFDDEVLNSNFWLYWRTMFAFENWHSALEMKLYIQRYIHHIGGLPDFTALRFTKYNQYESMILPMVKYLESHNVRFHYGVQVTNVEFDCSDPAHKLAKRIDVIENNEPGAIDLTENDLVFITNGGCVENSSMGSQDKPAAYNTELKPGGGWDMWRKIAAQDPSFGHPDKFCYDPEQTNWMSATVETLDQKIIPYIKNICKRDPFTGHVVTGGIVTVKDSSWLMSWTINRQPQFRAQPKDHCLVWVYSLFTDKPGDYVKKPMRECTGKEICMEWLYHIGVPEDQIEELASNSANTVPVMMPYIDAFFMPRAYGDEDQRFVRVVNASDVETIGTRDHEFSEELLEKVSFIHIDSNMLPYISPEEYAAYHDEFVRSGRTHEWTDVWKQRYTFSGKYGANLMEEVARYAMVAAQVAKDLEGQFDVIHAHDWLTYYAGIAAKRVSGKPLVVHMHATEFDRSGENINRRVYAIEKAGMQAADRVIAVSELTRRIVIGKYGIPAEKVVTVHNAVRFGESEEAAPERAVKDKVVTFLGRITYQKGPDYFVEAAAKVLKRVPDVRFVMAGSGDMMNHVIRRVARLGIADRFHFTGFLRGEDVHKMFQLSDVYVMPSVSEPFGISPLEAMRSNVPVIISKQSGVAEVLDYAVKVDYWDVDALADAIYGLIKYPALSGMFASKGLEEVTNLKWNDAAAKIKSVYEAVIEENKKQLK